MLQYWPSSKTWLKNILYADLFATWNPLCPQKRSKAQQVRQPGVTLGRSCIGSLQA